MQQERFDHLFKRVARFTKCRAQRLDAHGPALIGLGDQAQIPPVGAIKPKMINPQSRQRAIGKLFGNHTIALDHREIHHSAQQPPGDPWRAARAARNLHRAGTVGRHIQQPRVARHDLVQLFDLVKLKPRRNAEAVTQRRRQKPKPRGRPDQREGLQLDPHRARGGPGPDHQIKLEIFQRRIKHLFHRRVEPVNLVDEQHVIAFKIGQDRRQIASLGKNRPRGHAKPDAKLFGHDLGQGRLAKAGGSMKQRVIHRLAALARRLDKDRKIGARLGLTDEFRQRLRPQTAVKIFRKLLWAHCRIGF